MLRDCQDNFAGVVPVDEFLHNYMRKPTTEGPDTIDNIVNRSANKLRVANAKLEAASDDNFTISLVAYLEALVSDFPANIKPTISDTHKTVFKSIDEEEEQYSMPNITVTSPGMKNVPKNWSHAGTVVELKYKVDIFDDAGNINDCETSRDALVQLARSARSLMKSRKCFVFVMAIFDRRSARIFRFDHASFKVSNPFNWVDDETIFPIFFYRLYNPDGPPGRIYGDDDTISIPTVAEKKRMYQALCNNRFYKDLYSSEQEATKDSLWIKAVHCRVEDHASEPRIVRCFTIGPILAQTDGLFSRATHVYRVISEEDANDDNPTVYALKDAWRQRCRRPEADFYDVIARYCENEGIDMDANGMARCHGSVDLSLGRDDQAWDAALHKACPTDPKFERCHTRSLLSPVGRPLETFSSTKALVQALQTAVLHHQIAYDAGVLHRDVSEGNVMFDETATIPKGFLVDWDYAEFTHAGLDNFNKWFPERGATKKLYKDIDKSLKEMTGTYPFMAIEIMPAENTIIHGPHHDLESFFWLLVWMILRHTDHDHLDEARACAKLFDSRDPRAKSGWLQYVTPLRTSPLQTIAERLRALVLEQNPARAVLVDPFIKASTTVRMTHDNVLVRFASLMDSEDWPTNDRAVPFHAHSVNPTKDEAKAKSKVKSLLKEAFERRVPPRPLKRNRDHEEDESSRTAVLSSCGTTAKKAKFVRSRQTERGRASE
ncbi:hypothetical protein C8R44DRAFT_421416 [Mycena epipterygia]|nr:hypothetical protein C8R44DRAFT_421416 [Mycena epipterygia]